MDATLNFRVNSITADELKLVPLAGLLPQKINVQTYVSMPSAWLKEFNDEWREEFQKLIRQGVLVNKGRTFDMDFKYQGGRMLLNGKQVGSGMLGY